MDNVNLQLKTADKKLTKTTTLDGHPTSMNF